MKLIKTLAVIALVAVLLIVLISYAFPEKRIVGEWVRKNSVLGIETESVYRFNADGTGTMPVAFGIDVPMTYTIDEEKLVMTVSAPNLAANILELGGIGSEYTAEYTYKFRGSTITLTDAGMSFTMTRRRAQPEQQK